MKILLTGSNGLLGSYLVPELLKTNSQLFATSRGNNRNIDFHNLQKRKLEYRSLDLCDGQAIENTILEIKPDHIIHAGACTQVDYCELNQVDCWNTNVTATRFIASAAEKVNASLLFVSTDFVFSGEQGMYKETDPTGPVNYYGSSKLAAEKAVMDSKTDWSIARTVLVYGDPKISFRTNILTWVRDELSAGKPIKVVNDQMRTPTFAADLATGIRLMIEKNAGGLFHLSGKDVLTPYEMAIQTAEFLKLDKSLITAVDSSGFKQAAKLPLKTGFEISKAVRELGYSPIDFSAGMRNVFL